MSISVAGAVRRTARLLGLAIVLVSAGPPAGAAAATWTVNTTTDPSGAGACGTGICSLRQAIADASSGDTVMLPASATPYAVTLGVIDVTNAITISGAAASPAIEGDGSSQIFDVSGLPATSTVTISGVTISGGEASGITAATESGGAIYDDSPGATVDISAVTLSGNTSTVGNGGAIELAGGAMEITDSTLGPNNVAMGSSDFPGTGGAIDNDDGTLSITDSTISGNTAGTTAGGEPAGEGGGISDESNGTTGTTTLRYDTIASNTVEGTDAAGGNLFTDTNDPDGFTIADTIVADGVAPTSFNDCFDSGDFVSQGYNLTDGTDPTQCGFTGPTDLTGDPDLGALTNNGGETDTELPSAGSPEVGAIPNGSSGCPTTDQRGVASPAGSACDIGAVQGVSASSPSAFLTISASAAPDPVTPGQPVTDTFTIANSGPDAAVGVFLNDPLPSGVALVDASASQGSCSGTTTVTCDIGLITVGDPQTISVVIAPAAAGTVTNTASVFETTANPNSAHNSATATTTVSSPTGAGSACATSMTLDAVEVLASCITEQGDGTYLATGATSFADGAGIVDAGTHVPANLVLDPSTHEITTAPASSGAAQSGELEAGGVDIATGDLVIDTQAVTDPVSGVASVARVTGWSSVDLALSGWAFADAGVAPTVYLAPSDAGGGAIIDGQLAVPPWLGDSLKFGSLVATGLVPGLSGELAVQASSSGELSVVNGGISFNATVLGDSNLQLANAELSYQRAGDEWTGSAHLGFASLVKLSVSSVIRDGKLDDLDADFACATSKICGSSSSLPTLGAILDIKDVDLNMINLEGIDYTPPPTLGPFHIPTPCFTSKFRTCPPPQPAPQVDGAIIVGLLGDRVIAGGNFSYLLDGAFSAAGGVGLAPLYGSKFSDPGPLAPGESAQNAVDSLLSSGFAGVELANATIDFTPPGLLQTSGTMYLPPPPFPFQFLKGTISIGIDGAGQFTGEGSLDLVIPSYVPVLGGDSFGSVQAVVSDAGAGAEASLPRYCVSVDAGFHTYTECTPEISFLAGFDWDTGRVSVDFDGGSLSDYVTVPEASASSAAVSNSRTVHVPIRKQLASFTIHSAKGTPDVELIGPPGAGGRRRLMLATSKKLHNRTGALAWLVRKTHTESFLVFLPNGGSWIVKRLAGPRVTSVRVTVPRHPLRKTTYPRAVEHTSHLPSGTISTGKKLTLQYSVPHAESGTTVDLWAGTGPHGAGGVMIADGLPPEGAVTWKLSGLPSGRYWPYAVVNENGIPVSIEYWPQSVEIVNADAPPTPTGVQATLIGGQAYVAWNGVAAAETYAITATPTDGGAPVRYAVPASQVAGLLTLAPGHWAITVAALDSADDASLPTAPAELTIS